MLTRNPHTLSSLDMTKIISGCTDLLQSLRFYLRQNKTTSETTLRSQIWVLFHMLFSLQQRLLICPTVFSFTCHCCPFSLTQPASGFWLTLRVCEELNQQHRRSCWVAAATWEWAKEPGKKRLPRQVPATLSSLNFRYSKPVTL